MWDGLTSDPQGRALCSLLSESFDTWRVFDDFIKSPLPAWIAQGDRHRSFCVKIICSLDLLLLLGQAKSKNEICFVLFLLRQKDDQLQALSITHSTAHNPLALLGAPTPPGPKSLSPFLPADG
jgi:hypothetical protein